MAETSYVTQFQREAPDIEARKLGLMAEAKRLYESPFSLPAIEAAGLSLGEQQAMDLARQGIGAYEPFIQGGSQAITQGMDLAQRGALSAGAVQTAPMFQKAQDVLGYGVNTLAPMAQYESLAGAGLQDIGAGIGRTIRAGDLAGGFMQADLRPATGSIQAAQLAATAATPSDFTTSARILGGGMQGAAGATGTAINAAQQAAQQYGAASGVLGAGIGSLLGAAQSYDPRAAQSFMNPYQQEVTQQALREMRRQADIARQGQAAQAVGAGAFGGTREGVQRAEFERNVQDQMQQRIMQDYAQNFAQAQQASMQGFESQQQRQLGQAQGLQQAAGQSGQLTGQQAQLALQVAAQQFQQAGYDANTAMQLAQLQQTQQGQALQQSASLQGIGSLQGQQAMQQAQLGQSGAGLVGQLGAQQAQLGLLPGQIAQTQAGIGAQRAGLYGQLGQGIGALTAQQASTDLSKAQALGALGGQMGALGTQMGAMGEATQQLGAADVGMLGQIGLLERQNEQAQLDAMRGTTMQEIMDPYQRLGFMSDIYRGAPSTQMSMTSQTAPSASPLQTAAGLGIAGLSTVAGAQKVGLFG
jgi:hypothetical protein